MKTISRQRAGLIALALVLGMAASTSMAGDLVVSNVQVEQRPGTAIWDVTYDLKTVGGQPVVIHLLLSTDGGETFAFQCQAVSGDVGADVEPGSGLRIEWNAGVDWPRLVARECVLRVTSSFPTRNQYHWSEIELVSGESIWSSETPSLAVDRHGTVHVVWSDAIDERLDIFYKFKHAGGGWNQAELVSTESTINSYSKSPSLAVDAVGNVHVAWQDNNGFDSMLFDIFYKCKPVGGSWPTNTETVNTDANQNGNPSLAVDSFGKVHIAWTSVGGNNQWNIFYKCKPVGGSWPTSDEWVSSQSNSRSGAPSLAVDNMGTVHVAWQEEIHLNHQIWYKSKPDGGDWSQPVEPISNWQKSMVPSLVVDAERKVHVAWAVSNAIYYSCKPNGDNWSAPEEVEVTNWASECLGANATPSLAVDAEGRVHVAWKDGVDSPPPGHLFYKYKSVGEEWSQAESLSTDLTGESWYPSLTVDSLGIVHVAWQAYMAGDDPILFEIYYRYGDYNRALPPYEPRNIYPKSGAVNRPRRVTLKWTSGSPNYGEVTYDVYLGTSNPPQEMVSYNQPEVTYLTPVLGYNTDYYWRIVARNSHGESESSVWSFRTRTKPRPEFIEPVDMYEQYRP